MAQRDGPARVAPSVDVGALAISLIGIAIILYGFAVALIQFLGVEFARLKTGGMPVACQSVRLTLGMYILLGIEFMIASDIIHTVLSRELGDLIFVAALVAIRTAISFFLGKELDEARRNGEG